VPAASPSAALLTIDPPRRHRSWDAYTTGACLARLAPDYIGHDGRAVGSVAALLDEPSAVNRLNGMFTKHSWSLDPQASPLIPLLPCMIPALPTYGSCKVPVADLVCGLSR